MTCPIQPLFSLPGLRLGCTSFVVHEAYVPAFQQIVQLCSEVSLLLNSPGPDNAYLITRDEVEAIRAIATENGTSLNVHLPSDGTFDSPDEAAAFTRRIRQAIERTASLEPHSWVLHVPVSSCAHTGTLPTAAQTECILRCLAEIASDLPSSEQLCLENLEHVRTDFLDLFLQNTSYSRCMDIGHLWKDTIDPAPLLKSWYPRLRIIHLHGLVTRDHQSLDHMPQESIDAVMHPLWQQAFPGTITLEVFQRTDLESSFQTLLQSHERFLNAQRP